MPRRYGRFGGTEPSFIEGMARIFDFAGALDGYVIPQTEAEKRRADTIALRRAWVSVGQALRNAMGEFEANHPDAASARKSDKE